MDASQNRPPQAGRRLLKRLFWVAGTLLVTAGVLAAFWLYRFKSYTPAEVRADIKAAIGARHAPKRVDRFLELRYGSMTDPTNRQKAFLDFFNPGHIEGLQLIVQHTPEHMKQSNNLAMAEWVASYRRTMSPEEKAALGAYFNSKAGQAQLQQATGQYLKQDARYRASTAPVIRELMTTVADVQRH